MRFTTPPIAWLPHSTDEGPRSTSIRSMLPTSRLPKLKPPPGEEGSFSFTPSISATVWSLSAPRMNTEVAAPVEPLRVIVTPGTVRSRSPTVSLWRRSISSSPSTVTVWPTRDSGSAVRPAVTTIRSPSRSPGSGACWASAEVEERSAASVAGRKVQWSRMRIPCSNNKGLHAPTAPRTSEDDHPRAPPRSMSSREENPRSR